MVVWGVIGAALVFQLAQMASADPIKDGAAPQWFYWAGVPGMAVLAGVAIWRRGAIYLLIVAHLVIGVALLRQSPDPDIDVYHVTRDSCLAMSRGVDPYSITFERVYKNNPEWEREFYPAGFIVGDRTDFGYPYMPLSFMADYSAQVLTGDFRMAHLVAIDVAAALLASMSGPFAAAGAVVLLLTPRVFYVVEYAWAEPIVVVCLAWVVWCAWRKSTWLAYATGLLLVSKQHMVLVAPMILFLLPRPLEWRSSISFMARAAVTGLVVTLPLVLWNWHAFYHSAVELQIKNPFRSDSLNFAAMLDRDGHGEIPNWVSFGAALAAVMLALWRLPRTPAAFAAGVGGVYLAFFVLAKQAFCNYYFLIIGALCCAIAATCPQRSEQ